MRHATKKEIMELTEVIIQLAKNMAEAARWQAYLAIKAEPYSFSRKSREEILRNSEGHITHTLFEQLFKAYPLEVK